MRLDKFLSKCGFGSRSQVHEIINKKRVLVNGQIIVSFKHKVEIEHDEVFVDDRKVIYKEKVYIMLHKPKDVISATKDNLNTTVLDIIDENYRFYKLSPVGRLDKDTTGLLLLTNDGELSHRLISPHNHIDKCYFVKVDKLLNSEQLIQFSEGIEIRDGNNDAFITKPAAIEYIDQDDFNYKVVIQEGKYHQIKRMFSYFNSTVIDLKRVAFHTLVLDDSLSLGEYRELYDEEIEKLKG